MYWHNVQNQPPKSYKCGYCGNSIASEKGYHATEYNTTTSNIIAYMYVCHVCTKPTFFNKGGEQFPGPLVGNPVNHLPSIDIGNLFKEARDCFSVNAFTSCVMCCRKLLMNIAVTQGAEEGKNYIDYVNYLNDNNYIPPNGKEWVDSIRKLGNEANHKIEFKTKEDALRIINFTEMLLRFIYELPGLMRESG